MLYRSTIKSTIFAILTASLACALPSQPVTEQPALIPAPIQYEWAVNQPGFLLSNGIKVDSATSHSELGRAAIRALMAAGLEIQPEETEGDLQVQLQDIPPDTSVEPGRTVTITFTDPSAHD